MANVFTVTRPVRFADCDPAGIAFYPRLLEHLNGVVEDWFSGPLGYSFDDLHRRDGKSLPTVEMNVKFLRPGEIGDAIEWYLTVKTLGRSSMTLSVNARRPDGQDMLQAEPTLVHSDFNTEPPRSEPFPPELRERIETYCAA